MRSSSLGSLGGLRMSSSGDLPARVFASYIVYKGKGAVAIKPITPKFSFIPQSKSRVVERAGGLLFELAPSAGPRQYEWNKKTTFLLDPTECGALIAFEKNVGCEFLHDPNMNDQSKSGQITKVMKWAPSKDGGGVFLSLSVTDKSDPKNSSNLSIPITWAELEVIRSILRYSIPFFLGFDQTWSNPPLGQQSDSALPQHGDAPSYM